MHPQSLESIAMRWFEAFNKQDLKKLMSIYHPEAEHFSPKLKRMEPKTGGWIKGTEALSAWWGDSFRRLPTLHYHILSLTANSERVFMEYNRQVNDEEDMRIAEVLEIRDGLITVSRVYHS